MTDSFPLATGFADLARLDRAGLAALHARGRCPEMAALEGKAEGLILDPRWLEPLRAWRGKVFSADRRGKVVGINRLGIGPFEYHRYRFEARRARSAFSDREVVLLDHDNPGNPGWVRAFHDELVGIGPGLYLCCSHLKVAGRLRYMSYFAFDFVGAPGAGARI